MTPVASTRWKRRDGLALSWRLWDGEYVVFDEEWGDTHLLSFAAGEALQSLEASPGDAATLTRRIASSLEQDLNDELLGYVEKVVQDCSALGLIEPDLE